VPAASSRLRLDLESPEFQDVFFRLEVGELNEIVASLARLRSLDWNKLYCTAVTRGRRLTNSRLVTEPRCIPSD
jgi:hypothetical protein